MPSNIPVAGLGVEEDVPLLKGLDGVLKSSEAAMYSIQAAADDLRVMAQRQGYTYGSRAGDERSRQRKGQQMEFVLDEIEDIQREAERIPSTVERAPSRHPEEPPPAQDTFTSGSTEGSDKVRSNQETYEHYRDYFKDPRGQFSLRNIRKGVGERIASATAEGWGERLSQTEDGQWIDESGNLASNAAIMAFMRREKVAGAARGFGQSLAKGQTVRSAGLGAAPGIVAKGAGIAGAALFAGQQAGDFFEGQRAENAEWQAIFGGSNIGATGQRFAQKMFGLSQFGFMDSKQAEQLFQTVSQQGLQGRQRDNMLDFATSMYSELGMSVQQSTKLIEMASKTGQESLVGFASALRNVSDSAVEAGVNAEKARESFIRQMTTTTGLVGGGMGSVEAASATSAAQAGLGREFQNIEYGWFDPAQIQRMAAQQNVDYNVMVGRIGGDTEQFLDDRVQMMGADVQRVFKPGMYERAKQLIQQQIADGTYDPTNFAQMLLSGGFLIHMRAARGIIEQLTGTKVGSDFDAVKALLPLLSGELDPAGNLREQREEMKVTQVGDIDRLREKVIHEGGADALSASEREAWEAYQSAGDDVYEDRGVLGLGIDALGADSKSTRVKRAYRSHVEETGQVGGLVEHIATTSSAQDAIDKVVVETSEGPKEVSLWDAIKYYGAQVNRGELMVSEGSASGKTIAETFQRQGDLSVGGGTPEDAGVGEDWDGAVGGGAGGGGSVVLGLTPEARHALRPTSMQGVTYDDAWNPTDPHVTQESLPSGDAGD